MVKKFVFFIFLGLIVSNTVLADSISFKDNDTIHAQLSLTDINRIAIVKDKISSINAPTGLYTAKNDSNGSAYVTLLGSDPFMMFISTTNGHSVALFVTPQKTVGKTLVLNPITSIKNESHTESATTYQNVLVSLIRGMVRQDSPDGFSYRKALKPKKKDFFGIAELTPIAFYDGAELLGTIYKITNKSSKAITLQSSSFYEHDIRAVALSTQTLEPQASGLLYEVKSR